LETFSTAVNSSGAFSGVFIKTPGLSNRGVEDFLTQLKTMPSFSGGVNEREIRFFFLKAQSPRSRVEFISISPDDREALMQFIDSQPRGEQAQAIH
jgi:hypothetical protein